MSCVECSNNENLLKCLPAAIDYKWDIKVYCINCVKYKRGYIELEKYQKLYDEYTKLKYKYELIKQVCLDD